MAPKNPWMQRAEKVGLDKNTLAQLLGVHPATVWRGLDSKAHGTPHYLRAAIMAWEIMNKPQRKEWLTQSMSAFVFED